MTAVLLAFIVAFPASGADWAVNYGTAGPPVGTTFINSNSFDGNGNVFVAGTFNGATLTLGATTLTRIGAQDAFIAKLDANDNLTTPPLSRIGSAAIIAESQPPAA